MFYLCQILLQSWSCCWSTKLILNSVLGILEWTQWTPRRNLDLFSYLLDKTSTYIYIYKLKTLFLICDDVKEQCGKRNDAKPDETSHVIKKKRWDMFMINKIFNSFWFKELKGWRGLYIWLAGQVRCKYRSCNVINTRIYIPTHKMVVKKKNILLSFVNLTIMA